MADLVDDPVERIIKVYLHGELQGYQESLASVTHAVQSGWVPPEDNGAVPDHLDALRSHLRQTGQPDDDSFLLRFGLTAPGVQRGIIPPIMVLDENRGGFPPRRHAESAGQIRRLSEALAIGRLVLPSLSADTQSAIDELANLPRSKSVFSDAEKVQLFADMTQQQADQVALQGMQYLFSDEPAIRNVGEALLETLACFRHDPLDGGCCRELIRNDRFAPASMFRDSGDDVARQIITKIECANEERTLVDCLKALAWTRSKEAENAFRNWSAELPNWASHLHSAPEDYPKEAGWCLDDDGERRDLISRKCYRLILSDESHPSGISCRKRSKERCQACGSRLIWLFDFRKLKAKYFPGELAEGPRRIVCCPNCACSGLSFFTYRADHTSEWLAGNEKCEGISDFRAESCVREIAESASSPFMCCNFNGLDDASTLGGIPMWLQHANYPTCIECLRPMTFLAQHDNSSLGEEGIYYAFFCAGCHVSAVSYQQT